MHDLRVLPAARLEAELAENLPHSRVLGQDVGDQLPQPRPAGDVNEMTRQQRADALSLIVVDYDKGDLGLARLGDDAASAADDDLASVFLGQRDQGGVTGKIDIHEESDLSLRETALDREETSLQRLRAGAADRRQHVVLVIGP